MNNIAYYLVNFVNTVFDSSSVRGLILCIRGTRGPGGLRPPFVAVVTFIIMEQPTVLSLKVSRAPFSASPLLPRSASYPGYKILAEFLDKKRMQYIVMAERNKSSRHEQGGAKSSSQHAVNFERGIL